MRTFLLCLAAAALSACGPSFGTTPGATLAAIPDVFYPPAPDAIITGVTVQGLWVTYYAGDESHCELFSEDVKVTVNGAPVTDIQRGSIAQSWIFGDHCNRPQVHVPVELVGDPELHVVIEDRGGSVGVTVMNLTVLPTVTVTPDATGHIRAGSTVGLHYSPASDDLSQMTVSLRSTGTDNWYVNNLPFSTLFQGADGSITIPADMPAGSADFVFGGERLPQIVGCDTVSRCVVDYPWGSGRVPVQLEP